MIVPTMTIAAGAALALLGSGLGVVVVALRARHNIPFGHGDVESLHRAIRAHGNFFEWVPMTLLLIAALEASGGSGGLVGALLVGLVIARAAHPIALFSPIGSAVYFAGRVTGASVTFLAMVVASVALLFRL